QYPIEDIMLRNKNTPESIFEVQFTYSETGLRVTTNAAALTMPTRGNGAIYDGVEIPELGSRATTWTALRPNNYFFQAVQRRDSEDERLAINLAWEYNGVPFRSA